ncbi:Mitogen-activated protein kinase kinase kinase protein [Dioscorea alata]|uniref:Mitogen-activated protein kinase kinase kinase protein n=1 Tax=Dioscorea alata TaxID=55571 RepID=A0ACB7UBE8_DIOAL|nr:Mitogen-activated protein kinase kinase kinase protein [Dioscorea alata]
MESVGSSSPPPVITAGRYNSSQLIADRIARAIHHRLRLLHRSNAQFFILGATGNVYTVTLTATPSCTCPDRTIPCKHILFVLLRVLRLPFDDVCLRRRVLRPCHLTRLLAIPTSAATLAGPRARERFHQLYSTPAGILNMHTRPRPLEEGTLCPICLEPMSDDDDGGALVTCRTCGNSLHGECLAKWRRSRGRRAATCVVCRSRWQEQRDQERYINLAAFAGEDDDNNDYMSTDNAEVSCSTNGQ